MQELACHTAVPHGMATEANSPDIHGCVFHAANIKGYLISPNTICAREFLKREGNESPSAVLC